MTNFLWIGGALWVEAVNSEMIIGGARVDGWSDAAALQAWLREAGARFDEAQGLGAVEIGDNESLLAAMKRLRAALRAGCEATQAGRAVPDEAVAQINAALARRGVVTTLEASESGWRERETLLDGAEGAPHVVARAAARSWARGELGRIRPCANPDCILWFLDTSKNGTRRWCSMQGCGNRHKVTAHYERRKRQAGERS